MERALSIAAIILITLLSLIGGPGLAAQKQEMKRHSMYESSSHQDADNSKAGCPATAPIPGITSAFAMPVPVEDGARQLGKVTLHLSAEGAPALARSELIALLQPVLNDAWLVRIKQAAGGGPRITLPTLCANGLPAQFSTTELNVTLNVPLAARRPGAISLNQAQHTPREPSAEPAEVSAYANLFFGIDHIAHSDFTAEGWSTPNFALDGAIRWKNIVLEGEFSLANDFAFERRSTRLVYDMPGNALRFQAGDLHVQGTHGFAGRNILGMSLQRSYSLLQPHKSTRPDASRSFIVYQPSEVEVRVNGRTVRTFQLPPGEYKLSDLPLVTGGNQITVEVTEVSGRIRTYDFTVFYDFNLLKPGLSEWHIAAGFTPEYGIDGREYVFDRPAIYAEYRRGILENLTGEAFAFAADGGAALDIGLASENAFGSMFLRAAASYNSHELGYAFGFDWQTDDLGDWGDALTAVRLSADYESDAFGGLSSQARESHTLRLGGALAFALPDGVRGFASVNYADQSTDHSHLNASLSLSKTVGRKLSWTLSTGYRQATDQQDESNRQDQWSARFGINYRFSPDARLSADYDVVERTATTEIDQKGHTPSGSWAAEIEWSNDAKTEHPRGRSENALAGDLRYAGNRFVASAGHTRRVYGLQERIDFRSSATLATGLAFADGNFAWGRPVNGSFAIVDLPAEVRDGVLQVAPSAEGATAEANVWGPALVSNLPAYVATTMPVVANDVPSDYDPGSGAFTLAPPYKAGYAITAGTAGRLAVSGRLVDIDGEPIALLVGRATPQDSSDSPPHQFFTDRTGQFFIQGLAPGSWTLTLPDRTDLKFTFQLTPSNQRIIDVGTLEATENR